VAALAKPEPPTRLETPLPTRKKSTTPTDQVRRFFVAGSPRSSSAPARLEHGEAGVHEEDQERYDEYPHEVDTFGEYRWIDLQWCE